MLRIFACLFALLFLVSTAPEAAHAGNDGAVEVQTTIAHDPASTLDAAPELEEEQVNCAHSSTATGEIQLAQGCCRVCTRGKPCGNTCINRNYTCRQPPGCAC